MHSVWLGLGANVGDRSLNIGAAVEALAEFLNDIVVSPYYETAPRDILNQRDFLNAVVRGGTELNPLAVLKKIHSIEKIGGRNRETPQKKGPRTIDIDILLFDDLCSTFNSDDGKNLTIPHISMAERLFVLKPLLDLDSDIRDPRDGILWKLKASHLSDQRVKLYRK
jgi:2-amino-4-hydroxy-6-hydroxymethyldihydropteridine diphosphokinase